MKFFKLLLILSTLLFSNIETNSNICSEAYSINELDGADNSSSYSENYFSRWNSNKNIYLSFTTLEDGNLDLKLFKSASSSMKYQLFIGKSCNSLDMVASAPFSFERNTTIKIDKNQKYIVKLVKEKNGYSRYRLDFDFKSLKPIEKTNGLVAKYYSNENFIGIPEISRVDNNIDFDGTLILLNNQEYAVKWSGYIYIPNDGDYHFRVNQDDNIKIIVNSENIYERHSSSDGKFQLSHKRNFKKGYYPIEIFYNTNRGSNTLQLAWVNYAISKELEIIGSENLFTYEPKDISDNEVIHGHTLPPKPDPTINNATLRGVDSNNNGVRDDVERAIYKKYDKKLQSVAFIYEAKFLQRTLVEPIENAKDIQKDSTRTIDCMLYLRRINSDIKSLKWIEEGDYLKDLTFNNKERILKYHNYNKALSGGVYGSSRSDIALKSCSEEVVDVVEEMR